MSDDRRDLSQASNEPHVTFEGWPVTGRRQAWGRTADGEAIDRLELVHEDGSGIGTHEFGARWDRWSLPDRHGALANVLQAPDDLAGVETDPHFMGATVGRFANRLRGGQFTVQGTRVRVPPNEGANALHGGAGGFHARRWWGDFGVVKGNPAIQFRRTSPAGEMGFPGTLEVVVNYILQPEGGVRLSMEATTNAPTVVSLANHAYFNLAGSGTVHEHQLQLSAQRFTPVDADLLPTGEIAAVDGTLLDLRAGRQISDVLDSTDPLLEPMNGLDHNFDLGTRDTHAHQAPRWAATLTDPESGRVVSMATTAPGLQVYTGQALPTGGGTFPASAGLCLEAQGFPDAPNHPEFPSAEVLPGQVWRSVTDYVPDPGLRHPRG